MTYSNPTFAGTTTNGLRAIGGSPNPGANVNNFGSFTLSTAQFAYTGGTFTLQITFVAPQGISGSNQTALSAALKGTVRNDNQGGIFFDFNNTPVHLTYNDQNCEPDSTGGVPGQQTTCGTGEFYLQINDVSLDPGQSTPITGTITLTSPGSVSDCEQQVTELQNQITQLQMQINTANQTIQTQQQQIQTLQTQLNAAEQTIQSQGGQIQTLQTQLNTANQTVQTQLQQIQTLQAQLSQSQTAVAAVVTSIQQNFREVFFDPAFTIPGATPLEQLQNLANAIRRLNNGQKTALYKALGGTR